MNFVSIRLITENTKRLVSFYEQVTGLAAVWYSDDFAEVKTATCTLAIASTKTLQLFGKDIARAASNHTAILEFFVEDVDKAFEQVKAVVPNVVQEPTTMPWGNRSLLFRDPDGNLVNYFTPVSAEALKRFKGK